MSFARLTDIAYCVDKKLHEVSNYYHTITKPVGIFKYLNIDRY
jgi:hypothetical protein